MRIESEMNVPLLLLLLPTHNVDAVVVVVVYAVGIIWISMSKKFLSLVLLYCLCITLFNVYPFYVNEK